MEPLSIGPTPESTKVSRNLDEKREVTSKRSVGFLLMFRVIADERMASGGTPKKDYAY